jgi:hypothetical protein
MTSDLPSEPRAHDPGLDQLFRTLTAAATPEELAGEQDVLTMFRANVRPPANMAPVPGGPARGRLGSAAAGSRKSATRVFHAPFRWSIRLAAAATLALGGAAAAAYASALPAPVQHIAHSVLGFAGVPDNSQGSTPNPRHHHHPRPAAGHSATAPAQGTTAPTASKSAAASPSPTASPTPTPSVATGPSLLSATAASAEITAGSDAVIDGQLTRSGKGVPGVTVTLYERRAGKLIWQVAGTAQTNADGNVAVQVAALHTNAVFRLKIPGAPPSAAVRIIVQPPIAAMLDPGPGNVRDVLVVSTQYAHRGNVVVLQVQSAKGAWVYLRSKRLTAAGKTKFILSGNRLKNREVRVVLLATVRHGASVLQNPILVPAPS